MQVLAQFIILVCLVVHTVSILKVSKPNAMVLFLSTCIVFIFMVAETFEELFSWLGSLI